MKMPKKYLAPISIFAIGAMLLVYAATQITVNNTGTVTSGVPNFALAAPSCGNGGQASTSVCENASSCNSSSGSFNTATTSYIISDWSVSQGGSTTINVCLKNAGASAAVSVSWTAGSNTPAGLTCASPTTGTVGNGGFLSIALTCSALITTPPSPSGTDFGTFTIS